MTRQQFLDISLAFYELKNDKSMPPKEWNKKWRELRALHNQVSAQDGQCYFGRWHNFAKCYDEWMVRTHAIAFAFSLNKYRPSNATPLCHPTVAATATTHRESSRSRVSGMWLLAFIVLAVVIFSSQFSTIFNSCVCFLQECLRFIGWMFFGTLHLIDVHIVNGLFA